MKFLRLFKKNLSLRIVNIIGLFILFACLLLSASYIKRELSYDRHYSNADRIVRMSMQRDNQPVDGRIWSIPLDEKLLQIPEIEHSIKMVKNQGCMLSYEGRNQAIKVFYAVTSRFLDVFDLTLIHGVKENALQQSGQALISETLARELFEDIDVDNFQKSAIIIQGAQWSDSVFVTGIFKDMTETSHFTTDLLLFYPDEFSMLTYNYLLLKENTDIKILEEKIDQLIEKEKLFPEEQIRILLMPLTDIHLHSHNLREMSVNGNINYIYLIIGANALLFIVVFFNLWLNASLVFGRNKRYYQLLRLHGTPPTVVFKDETLSALLVGILSISLALLAAFDIASSGYFSMELSIFEIFTLCVIFLLMIILVSLIPALQKISLTQFLNTKQDLKPVRFSYSNIKYMLVVQYAVVMLVVILTFCINKQMNMMKNLQVGGSEQNVLVLPEQLDKVKEKYALLKSELLKHKEIEAVTACFQVPGDAIRDHANVKKENETEGRWMPIMIAGEDFLPFFNIPIIAGKGFSQGKFDYQTELSMGYDFWLYQKISDHIEEYVMNRKALEMLGFETPEEAIGQLLQIEQGGIGYINKGIIVGVTDDFNYTGLYEETNPLLILQRNGFLHNIMVRLDSSNLMQARQVFENVWNEVNPDYPTDYIFMNDVFKLKYRNEMNAQYLVFIFSLLCFAVADLGLIVFVAYIIKRRTREIGLRKVHGASIGEVIKMLNWGFIRYIVLAFVIAVPVAWYVMHRWLEQFAYRTALSCWIFALAGLGVLLLSVLSVTLQSWRAATANPVDAIKVM